MAQTQWFKPVFESNYLTNVSFQLYLYLSVMVKNVFNPVSLLIVFCILISSCSSPKKYTSSYKKKTRTRTESKSHTRSNSNTTKKVYTSSNDKRSNIINTAMKYIGKPYVYGGKSPSSGFDCSGFTSHVFKENGVNVLGSSSSQAQQGQRKSMQQLKKGDLVFFGAKNKVSHVAIVANVDRSKIEVIHSTSSRGVVIDNISSSDYWQKRYLFGRDVLK